jgi:nucleotide-binding universal stress UspA family protein
MSRLDTLIPRTAANARFETEHRDRPVMERSIPLLVATDGRPQSDLALLAARRLATEEPLEILTVLPRCAHSDAVNDDADIAESIAHRGRVEWQLRRVLGSDVRTCIDVRAGDPPATLAAAAAQHGAPLLVVGIGRPKVSNRLLGDESTLRLVRAAHTPVLAIAPGCALPAHRVVIAVDFSPTSYAAARLAMRLCAPGAEVTLVHVAARPGEIVWGSAAAGFRGDPMFALETWCDRLRREFGIGLMSVVLHGDPATELIAIASERGADLVSVGAHGHGPPTRRDIGSVTARLVRCANYSVVVAPRSGVTEDPSARSDARAGFRLTQDQRPADG